MTYRGLFTASPCARQTPLLRERSWLAAGSSKNKRLAPSAPHHPGELCDCCAAPPLWREHFFARAAVKTPKLRERHIHIKKQERVLPTVLGQQAVMNGSAGGQIGPVQSRSHLFCRLARTNDKFFIQTGRRASGKRVLRQTEMYSSPSRVNALGENEKKRRKMITITERSLQSA